jgi:hypothetical protein
MCCFTQSIHTLRLSVGGRTDARTHGRKIFTQYSGISPCSLGSTDNRIGLSLKLGTLTSLFLLIGLMDRFAPAPQGFLQKHIVGIDVILF